MNKKLLILAIMLFGFFLIPNASVIACGGKMTCCKKEVQHNKVEKNNCCHADKKHHKQEEKDDCGGKCTCNCPAFIQFALLNFHTIPFSNPVFFSFKNDWRFLDVNPQSVYLSVWLPPKISC